RAPARAGRHLVRRAARRLADHARRDRRDGRGRAGGPAGVCPADPTVSRCERGLSGRDLGGSVLSSFPVRDDRSFRAHAPSLLPLQSARLHHGLPSGALPRRGRGALGAALRPAGVVRRGGAAADLAHRRVVRAAADPVVEDAAVAPAKRELTFLLADPERPRYGYYVDHVVDAFSTAVIGVGVALSPYVSPCVALGLVIVYLGLSINVYLESNVFGVFRLAYGRLGPTEIRIMLIAANGVL